MTLFLVPASTTPSPATPALRRAAPRGSRHPRGTRGRRCQHPPWGAGPRTGPWGCGGQSPSFVLPEELGGGGCAAPSYNQACLHPFLARGAAGFCTAPTGALSTLLQGCLPQPPAWLLLESICIRKRGTKQKENGPRNPGVQDPAAGLRTPMGAGSPAAPARCPMRSPWLCSFRGAPQGCWRSWPRRRSDPAHVGCCRLSIAMT